MSKFLKLLIYELRTVDGNRDTAKRFIDVGVCKLMGEQGYESEEKYRQLEQMVRHKIMLKVFSKY